MSNKTNIISIPPDCEITFTMGGSFYQRLNKLIIDYGDSVNEKQLFGAMGLIKHDKAHTDKFAYNLETLIILLRDVEKTFQDEGLTVDNAIDLDKIEFGNLKRR